MSAYKQISKSRFKAHALEILRRVEQDDEPVIITDRARQALLIKKYHPHETSARERLKGSVLRYDQPFEPVAVDDWEAMQ